MKHVTISTVESADHRRLPHVMMAGIPAALASESDLVDAMQADSIAFRAGLRERPVSVLDINGHAMSLYKTNAEFAAAIDEADVVHADGQFVVALSRLGGGERVPERTATTDLIGAAAERAAELGLSFYLLGGEEDVNAAAAERLAETYPGLVIAGRRNGYFTEDEEDEVIAEINAVKPDIVWVGLGKPKEQIFVHRVKDRLKCAWIVTCGGCFNFVVGDYLRAPKWMQKYGLEWVHRMATGPRYLVLRYATTVPHAMWLAARWYVANLFRPSADQKG